MPRQNAKKSYSPYVKATYATIFTIGSFLLTRATGYLFSSSGVTEENKPDENMNTEQNALGLRRSIDQANQTVNQETSQSLQLVNSSFAGNFAISDIQDMVIENNIAYVAAGENGFQIVDLTNLSNPIITGSYQLTGGYAHQLNLIGNYAYIAYDVLGLRIVDVSNPYNISLAGVYMMGICPQRAPVKRVAVTDGKAFIMDTDIGQYDGVDISQPTQVFRVYLGISGSPQGVSVVGSIVYVTTQYAGLQLINVSNPTNPSLLSSFNIVGWALGVSVVGGIAYVAAGAGLQLINVSNPTNPSLLGSFNTAGGAYGVSVVGSIAYVAAFDAGLQLINVSNPTNPSLLSSFNIVGGASGVSVVGGIAYVAVHDFGLQLINVSNPTNPGLLGSFNIVGGATGVSVVGGITYVVGYAGLQLINVSNPTNPSLLGSVVDTLGVSVVGSIAYVATGYAGLQLINVSNPTNLSLLGSFNPTGEALLDVSVVGRIAYVTVGGGLQIIDVSRVYYSYLGANILENKFINDAGTLGNTFLYTEQDSGLVLVDDLNFIVGTINIGGIVLGVSVVGSIAYVSAYPAGLQLINVSNPTKPNLLGSFNLEGVYGVSVVGGIAYVADSASVSLQLINVSNPTNPSLLSSFNTAAGGVSVVGGIAYVVGAGLQLINVSNPTNPSLLGSLAGGAYGISGVVGGIAYVAAYTTSGIFQLINVSNPNNPSLLGSFNTAGYIEGAGVVGSIAYVATYNGLQLIDVSDPTNPSLLGFNTEYTSAVSVVSNIAYVVNGDGCLLIDVSDPTHLQLIRQYNIPGTAVEVAVSGNFVYVAAEYSGLQIFQLLQETTFSTSQIASKLATLNSTTYLSDSGKNLYLLDLSNTSNPIEISRYLLSSQATDMVVAELQDGNNNYIYLYVAESLNGIEVVDVTNSSFPIYAGSITANIANARTVQIEGNRLYVNNNNVEILVFDLTVLHYLNVSVNNLNLIEGTTTITNTQLNIMAVNPFNLITKDINNIVYTINNLQQGQFELVNSTISIANFTQAQINNNALQFTYNGNGATPSFEFTLSNGNVTAGPYVANIVLIRLPQIISNAITCNEGQTVLVTSNNISAIDIDGSQNPTLIFIVNNMGNSQFELASSPGVIITRFTQQNIIDGVVQFSQVDPDTNNILSIDEIMPFYQLIVTNGQNQSSISNATIDFDATPRIIQNQLTITKGGSLVLNPGNLNATDLDHNFTGNLSFQVSNVTNGHFELVSNPSVPLFRFTQQQISNGQIQFVQDNSDNSPNYVVNVTDGRATSPPSSPTVSFNSKEAGINAGLVAGGVIGGMTGLAALMAGSGFFARNYRNAQTRKPHPFADAVQGHLKLQGMDNFKTEQGQKFAKLMEDDMVQALLTHGFDILNMHPKAADDLARKIAAEAKNKITGSTTFFGHSEISLDQLENKIDEIAAAVSQYKDLDQVSGMGLEDDNTIGLKNFMPSLNLRNRQIEVV